MEGEPNVTALFKKTSEIKFKKKFFSTESKEPCKN